VILEAFLWREERKNKNGYGTFLKHIFLMVAVELMWSTQANKASVHS